MAYFVHINENNIVDEMIVADIEHINSGVNGDPSKWIRIEENEVGMSFHYDPVTNVFYEPQPFPSWTLDSNHNWQPPVPYPDDGEYYSWIEESMSWELMSDCCNGQK